MMLSKALRSIRPMFTQIAAFTLLLSSVSYANAQQTVGGTRLVADRLTAPIVESSRATLPGPVHPLAIKANDRGAVSDGMKLDRIQIVLKRSDAQETALKQLVGDLHTPGSASYHKWLTPDDFGKQFGPSDADVATLESWLSSKGFGITKLNPGRQTLEISGTAGQFKSTFHTEIHSFQVPALDGPVKTETRYSVVGNPEIPEALAPVFGGFVQMNNFRFKSHATSPGRAQYNVTTHEAKPEWTVGTAANPFFLLGPGDFAVQYDLNPVYTAGIKGDGQSIAIVNEANINIAQVNNYRALFGLPVNPPQVIIDGNDPGVDGINSPFGLNYASAEAYLDVELSGAAAPNAQINLVIANDTVLESGLSLAIERAVYSNVSPIISLSFGGCEANQGSFNSFISGLWEQAAAQGITVLVSSGDQGSAGCDNDNTQYYAIGGQAVNGLASTPYNVAVGGTDFYYSGGTGDLNTYWSSTNAAGQVSLIKKVPEQPFNTSQYGLDLSNYYNNSGGTATSIFAASGGASTSGVADSSGSYTLPYPKPSWQTGTGVPADKVRDLPDVSIFGALASSLVITPVCANDGDCIPVNGQVRISEYGGTSLSAPSFAGIMALVDQKYGRQGQANYVLYPLAAQFPAAFNDVVAGTNAVPCATTGYTPKDCKTVTSPLQVTDPSLGPTTEGEISVDGTTASYNATAGYDLASGLGSVDANELVTNWNKVTFAGTTTTLTPSSTSFAHGTSITVSGSVKASSGTPTGDVGLLTTSTDPNNQGETFFTLASGSYTGSINFLPGGTYDISGYYGGDGKNSSSTSTPVQIIVSPEASTTALKIYDSLPASTNSYTAGVLAAGSSIPYGTPSVLSGQVGPAAHGYPTGSVAFLDGTATINTAVINAEGDAEFNNSFLPGSHSITAKYSGDGSYNTSTSAATAFTVTKNTPLSSTLFLNYYTNGDVIGGQVTYLQVILENSASSNALPLAPTGTVTITGAPTGTPSTATVVPAVDPATGVSEGLALFAVPSGASGTYNISFNYGGDSNYNAVAISAATYNFAAAAGLNTTTTATVTATATSPASLVTLSTTVTGQSGHGAPTGTVYLISGGYVLTSANLPSSSGTSASLSFRLSSSSLFQGTNPIQVFYNGDNTYNTSSTVVTVNNPLSDFSLIPLTTIVKVPGAGTANPGVQTDVINLSSYNGFAGAVGLTCQATGGVTCSLSANSSTLTSGGQSAVTLTVNTTKVTAAGTYNAVVTGTDSTGKYIHTIGLQVVTPLIATPSFTLAGTAVAIASPGSSGNSTITVTPAGGFTGSVALTCALTGPAGAVSTPTCSAASASVTGTAAATATLTFNTTATTTAGSYTATVTGTSGTTTATTSVAVTVTAAATPSFTLAGTAVSIASPGSTGNSTITVTPAGGFTGSVALTCSLTGPAGAVSTPTCSAASASVTGTTAATATLTFNTTATTTAGSYTATVTGTSGTTTATTSVAVTVTAAATKSFTLAGTAVTIASPGSTGNSTITVTPVNSFTGTVALTCSLTGPAGAVSTPTCSAASASVTGTSAATATLTFNTTATTTAGSYTATVTGTSGTTTATTSVAVTVTPAVAVPNFTLAGTAVTVASPGVTGASTITVTPTGGFTGTVALTCTLTGPAGAVSTPTCSAASASITGTAAATATLTFNTTATTTAGSYTATVTGTSGTTTATTSVAVTVNAAVVTPPSFTLSGTAVSIATQGGTGTSTISVTGTNGFSGTIALTCAVTSSPSGAADTPTCAIAPTSVTVSGLTGLVAPSPVMTVSTTAQVASLTPASKRLFGESGGAVLALLAFFGLAGRRNKRALKSVRAMRILSVALLFALIAGAGIGCGGGGTAPLSGGTTTGAYVVTVTGTSAASGTTPAYTTTAAVNVTVN